MKFQRKTHMAVMSTAATITTQNTMVGVNETSLANSRLLEKLQWSSKNEFTPYREQERVGGMETRCAHDIGAHQAVSMLNSIKKVEHVDRGHELGPKLRDNKADGSVELAK